MDLEEQRNWMMSFLVSFFFFLNSFLGKLKVVSLSICSDSQVVGITNRICSSFLVKTETNEVSEPVGYVETSRIALE